MKEIITKIGDHFIHIICDSNKLAEMFNVNFLTINNYNLKFDLSITIKEGYGVPFLDYKVDITKNNDQIVFRRADYLIEVDCEYKVATILVNNGLALKHALMNIYSSFIVYRNWGLLIHSSSAMEKDNVHVFAGQSGAGKSTVAKLSYPRVLLSDEATLVKISPNNVTVFNSPFRSEIEADKLEREITLDSLNLLYQSHLNKRNSLTKSEAILRLMNKVFAWQHSQEETKNIMKLLTNLVNMVPVYELHFQKNNTFWELIS
ncbi:hypothetical protein QFZ31_005264 [Neobacillus niacini]|uniref:hypothetical protein n=1 Tax=Neobacillus driksii TaxID=3035913 RepID=UPI0027831FD2|nr:hypothetical protein [Neobacillus niacini]MDQ0975386.1 hypothetical protein [Neobacillus niacini]